MNHDFRLRQRKEVQVLTSPTTSLGMKVIHAASLSAVFLSSASLGISFLRFGRLIPEQPALVTRCQVAKAYWGEQSSLPNLPKTVNRIPDGINFKASDVLRAVVETDGCKDGTKIALSLCAYKPWSNECITKDVPNAVKVPQGGVVYGGKATVEWRMDWPMTPPVATPGVELVSTTPKTEPHIKFLVSVTEAANPLTNTGQGFNPKTNTNTSFNPDTNTTVGFSPKTNTNQTFNPNTNTTLNPKRKTDVGEAWKPSINYVDFDNTPDPKRTHLECQNLACVVVDGPGFNTCSEAGEACDLQTDDTPYPRLQANIFDYYGAGTPACKAALSSYNGITRGALFSSRNGDGDGFDYGERKGFGSFKDKTYDLGSTDPTDQQIYGGAKSLNPDLKIFSHRSIEKIEAKNFDLKDSYPQKWFLESVSPKWLAYTPLMKLKKAVPANGTSVTFTFEKSDVEKLVSYGVTGSAYADWRDDQTKNDWYYLSFYNNDAGGVRGTLEIMAIQDIEIVGDEGIITVALKNLGNTRTIYGATQSYSAGAEAGVISSSSEGFGSLTFLMNRYCRRDLEAGSRCGELRVDGSTWTEAAAEYTGAFLMQAKYNDIYLNDGAMMDADNTFWSPDNFRLADPSRTGYYLDQDLNGEVDDVEVIDANMYKTYDEFAKILKTETAPKYGRSDFGLILNGYILPGTGDDPLTHSDINGRRYEDFNGWFQGTYNEGVEQYQQTHNDVLFLGQPVYSYVSERDRNFIANGKTNFEEHRNTLAMTLVLGDGFYGPTQEHATDIAICNQQPAKEWNDWFDEFSVDANGYSSKHPSYSAEELCQGEGKNCEKNRYEHLGWLGKALGRATSLESQGYKYVWRRNFENGVAFFSIEPRDVVIPLEKPYKKITGIDTDNNGVLYNDGSTVTEVVLPAISGGHPGQGIVLMKTP